MKIIKLVLVFLCCGWLLMLLVGQLMVTVEDVLALLRRRRQRSIALDSATSDCIETKEPDEKDKLLAFMVALEAAIPPPEKCRHSLSRFSYGSNETGWEDRLALQLNDGGEFRAYFFEMGDLEKPVDELVREVVELHRKQTEESVPA